MRFGFGLPMLPEHLTTTSLSSLACRAEQAGFSSLWTSEVPTAAMFESLSMLSYVAAVTERVELGLGVVLLPLRTPAVVARQAATVDVLSGGRLVLGFGFGRRREHVYAEHGLPTDERLHRYLGAIDVVRQFLQTGSADYDGPEWYLHGNVRVPQPVRQPRPPILLAARSERSVRRVVNIADGWIVSASAPPDEIRTNFTVVSDELRRSGRDRNSFTIVSRIFVLLDPTPTSLSRMEALYRQAYGPDGSRHADVSYIGDVAGLRTRVADLVSLGADHVILNPVLDYERHLDQFARWVLPAFDGDQDIDTRQPRI